MVSKAGQICIYQGDDWAGLITVNNCDGSAMDLTGYNVQAQIREGPADQQWRIAACFLPAIILPNQISISLTNIQTTWLRNLNYIWDLQIISPAGIITTIVSGPACVTPEVTRERRVWRPPEIAAFEQAWFYGGTVRLQEEFELEYGRL